MIPVTEYMLNNAEHLRTILRVVDSTIDSVHKYIVSCIKLTVKITVNFPSSKRFGSYETFFKSNAHNKQLYGNGIVVKVKKSERECKCSDQVQKPHPTWCLFIATSRFVVFDNLEAENVTKVDITFDGLIGSVKTINVEKIYQYNSDETCIVMGYTCDETICKELRDSLQVQKDTYKILEYAENKVVVISHPHGMEKHISFGSCSENELNFKKDSIFILNQLEYDAPLCDGCAGAPVIKLNDSFTKRHSTHIIAEFLLHTFSQSEGNGNSGWARIPMTVAEYLHESFHLGFEIHSSNDEIQKDGKKLKSGHGGLEILYDDDIQGKKSSCKKNPSHEHFHPVNSFKELNLPVVSEKRSLIDSCIQTVSELSGRIAVNYTSHGRPDIDPVTQATFPSCKLKGTKCLRYGSGTIVSLVESDHADFICTCANCKVLKSTDKKSYCIYVQTANHVVFDSSEACESSFRIGFDDDASPEVLLHGLRVVESDINTGRSLVLYVTHDVELGIKLSETISCLYSLDRQLYLKFKRSDDVNLAVIVSHPHGSCKRVSFGKWLHKDIRSSPRQMNYFIRFIYDTPTGPGSSGGAVLIVGGSIPHVTKRLIPPHLHRETSGDGKSTSCFEVDRFSSNE
ncbi:uncharacterized protein LOC131950124 [Physella acuta]|uniref:uncharacterized protein LOC131950124 n=1 Tax=Physella acuta TaxID=109671 RepID=UPI0027DC59BA|nr:uncharacterized protein LOC131950124 [Physella acuta]